LSDPVGVGASVLVVGAGVAGLALGRALTQRGVDCTVVERRRPTNTLGMGLNLPGNAVRTLRHLGVLDQTQSHGAPVSRREYRNSKGRLLFSTDDAAFWTGVGQPHCIRHGHLLEALRTPPTATTLHGVEVVSARPSGGRMAVQMADGDLTMCDFVVAADGVHSKLRSAIADDNSAVGRSAMTQSSWRFIVGNPGVDCWTTWSGARATFLLVPVGNSEVYGYASSTRGETTGSDPGWLAQTFADFTAPVTTVIAALLAGFGEMHHARVEEVRIPTWHSGRLVLIGDAAHATGPVWAQGAALAMEDALVLADQLAHHTDWSTVGPAFEAARRARVEHVQKATDQMSNLAKLPTWLRAIGAPFLGPRAYREAYEALRSNPI